MYSIGGITCDEEFSLFLAANPGFIETPPLSISDPAYFYKRFLCSDGGVRFSTERPQTCIESFQSFLRANTRYVGLTDAGVIALFGESYLTSGGFGGFTNGATEFRCQDGSYRVYINKGSTLTGTNILVEDSIYAQPI